MSNRPRFAFSLLEVMVAVAILGMTLVTVFSAQVGAMRNVQMAKMTSAATLLARCKMEEIEEEIAKEGFPAESKSGEDKCCEDAETPGIECEWRVERIKLPDMSADGEEGVDASMGSLSEDREAEGSNANEELSPESLLSGGGSAGAECDIGFQYAYPILKPSIEEQVRRATVRVKWMQGEREVSFEVTQFLVAEPGAATPTEGEE